MTLFPEIVKARVDQRLVSDLRGTIQRIEQLGEYIEYGPNKGHRFEKIGPRAKRVQCTRCMGWIGVSSVNHTALPVEPCDLHETNEGEKYRRTLEVSDTLMALGADLLFNGRRLWSEAIESIHAQRKNRTDG